MRYGHGIPPVADEKKERTPGATMTDAELRRKIEAGEIKKDEFTRVQLERLGIKVPPR